MALPGGLLIITGGEGGRGAKLEADQLVVLVLGGRGAGGFTGEAGREFLFTGRGTVA